jgi:hypothetical protein
MDDAVALVMLAVVAMVVEKLPVVAVNVPTVELVEVLDVDVKAPVVIVPIDAIPPTTAFPEIV